jgi:hypothetical protein
VGKINTGYLLGLFFARHHNTDNLLGLFWHQKYLPVTYWVPFNETRWKALVQGGGCLLDQDESTQVQMGYIARAVGHLLSPCYDQKHFQVHFTFRPGGRSCTRVIIILFWREINLCSWRFFKVPRLLILVGNCSISLGLTKIFVPGTSEFDGWRAVYYPICT